MRKASGLFLQVSPKALVHSRGKKHAAQTELLTRFGEYSSFSLQQYLRILYFGLFCSGFLSEHFILPASAKG